MKDTNLIVRMNSKTKEEAMKVASSYGLSLSALVNAYLSSIAYSGQNLFVLFSHRQHGQRHG
jgi:antitoxin component of RelBE/YafQ-DinJ toxin-antitoxin module